jgi:hypothetical protein
MRETLRVARTDVSIRRFLGVGLSERLPDHSIFRRADQRFADSSVFERLFAAVLRQCTEAGLVGGRRLVVDATHIEADAALRSLRAELAPIDGDGDGDGEMVPEAVAESRPALALAAPRSGADAHAHRLERDRGGADRCGRQAAPQARASHASVDRGQVAVDPKARVIVAVQAERATGGEADCLTDLVTRARFAGHAVSELAAESGHASQDAYAALKAPGTAALTPPAPGTRRPTRRASGCAPRQAATRRLITRRTPRARSRSSNATAPTAPAAAAPGCCSRSCWPRRPR